MKISTKYTIMNAAKPLFAISGYEGFSMRTLADASGVGLSSIYHFFSDKDALLKDLFNIVNKELGAKRSKLTADDTASQMLYDRILFQFENIEDVIFVLKYYLHFRPDFLKLDSGYLPTKGYLHIEEVLEIGVASGELATTPSGIASDAKVIAHAINGFLLEYYPNPPIGEELHDVIKPIHLFLMRSLQAKEGNMK